MNPAAAFHQLNRDYLAVHRAKEDRYWGTHMGTDLDDAGFVEAEKAWVAFLSDPARLDQVRGLLRHAEGETAHGLKGWQAVFESHIVESPEARAAWDRVLTLEAELQARRRGFRPTHVNAAGVTEAASLGGLSISMATNPDEAGRRSSFEGLKTLERWVLDQGFAEIVKARNAFARAQGSPNYFDYKVKKTEGMTADQLFVILDEFEALTRDAQARGLDELKRRGGASAVEPWNQAFYTSGDITAELDPYFSFARAVSVWVESFRNLGISYRGASLTLDLLERPGKHENGFCHGPVPAFFDEGRWVPAVVNFTANAEPGRVGSGLRALETLFHEGGHAAHFANVTQNSPAFSQEFAPTSMAYAETQSMFLDNLLNDADWMTRYARNAAGEPVPADLIRRKREAQQPFAAAGMRGILVVPVFERQLYRLADADLTADRILALARDCEKKILLTEGRRPLLAIPHLLNQESSASYQGYLLAEMAVAQTRDWFFRTQGFITDNPQVGPLLARHYWAPGNSQTHGQTLRSLTGQAFSGRALAERVNRTADQVWAEDQQRMAEAARRPAPQPTFGLDASIRVVDGTEVAADNAAGDEALGRRFEAWLTARAGRDSAGAAR